MSTLYKLVNGFDSISGAAFGGGGASRARAAAAKARAAAAVVSKAKAKKELSKPITTHIEGATGGSSSQPAFTGNVMIAQLDKPVTITNGFDAEAYNKRAMKNNLDIKVYGTDTASSINANQKPMEKCMAPAIQEAISKVIPTGPTSIAKKLTGVIAVLDGGAAVGILTRANADCITTTAPKFISYK